jgi:DnaJ domain
VPPSEALPDYYAVLQVHPGADIEVIEAAYRQLMKKHHPDVAGDDPQRVAEHHARSKAINQAFGVLRHPDQRRRYDVLREQVGTRRPDDAPRSRPARASHASAAAEPTAAWRESTSETLVSELLSRQSVWPPPFALIAAAYYLLPGAYEWEPGRRQELAAVLLIPVLGVGAFCLATGRLSGLIGHSLNATLLAWGLLLVASFPLWRQLPRVAAAVAPTAALALGLLDTVVTAAHVPVWVAWALLSCLSLIVAARQYVFGVLPALGICLIVARLGS